MNRRYFPFLFAMVLFNVACETRAFLTCEDGYSDGEADGWNDVENCNEWGTTNNAGDGASAGYDECYAQTYDSTYTVYIEEYCGEGFV